MQTLLIRTHLRQTGTIEVNYLQQNIDRHCLASLSSICYGCQSEIFVIRLTEEREQKQS